MYLFVHTCLDLDGVTYNLATVQVLMLSYNIAHKSFQLYFLEITFRGDLSVMKRITPFSIAPILNLVTGVNHQI